MIAGYASANNNRSSRPMQQKSQTSIALSAVLIAVIGYVFVIGTLDAMSMQSADLFAMWLAGEFMAMGQMDQIYPPAGQVFDMSTPDAWWPHVAATDPDARIFPYIYPPIWAKLMSFITPVTTFYVFDLVFLLAHQVMLVATICLAAKLGDLRGQTGLMMVALTYAALVLTLPIGIALGENQPQILVSFLIVFAFERAQSHSPRAAGILLALAASIKGYPLLFLVIFLARRDWRAVGAFGVAGAALGLTSIALTGWALHAEYLHLLSVLSKSVIVTGFSISVDAFLAGNVFTDSLTYVFQPSQTGEALGWASILKGTTWATLSSIAQIAAVIGVGVLAAKRRDDALVLPVAAAVFAAISPLSWAYTYLPVYVFIALLPLRLGAAGWIGAAVFAAVFHPSVAAYTFDATLWNMTMFTASGFAATSLIAALMVWAVVRPNNAPRHSGQGTMPVAAT